MALPIVAIIGRPNVGKSTLFNRVAKSKVAITDESPGVTRDRHYRKVEWAGRYFYIVDTGGFLPQSDQLFDTKVREQALIAIDEADLLLFMVDAQVGPADIDVQIARMLKKTGKSTILVANNADTNQLVLDANAFYSLGLDEPFAISSAVGFNIGNLLDKVIAGIPDDLDEPAAADAIRVAVIGRPNVGKSSMVNKLLGDERLIVTNTPGTTRDSIDTSLNYTDHQITLVDTAGLRRAAMEKESLEFYTELRAVRSLQRADVAMVLVDATQGITVQDIKVIEHAEEERKGILVVVNKWDLVEKDPHSADEFTEAFHRRAPMMKYIPLLFVSALTGQRVTRALDMILQIHAERLRRIATPELNSFLGEAVKKRTPPARGGKFIKIYYVTQTDVAPPTFVFFANHPDYIDRAYTRYLENSLREKFGFEGNSLRLKFKRRE